MKTHSFRESMTWLHTWAGLVVGWLLFFIFLTGTVGYFDSEIDRWMRPEMKPHSHDMDTRELVNIADQYLRQNAPPSSAWRVFIPGGREVQHFALQWEALPTDEHEGGREVRLINPNTGEQVTNVRATAGGQQLYRMHYRLHYVPGLVATLIVGICSMFLFLALTTGVIAHRKIFKDFFTFRTGRGQRSWFDIHNIFGVLALPFHFMITYSGLGFFFITLMPLIFLAVYKGDTQKVFTETEVYIAPATPSGEPGTVLPLERFYKEAQSIKGTDVKIESIYIDRPGDAAAKVNVRVLTDSLDTFEDLSFNANTGDWLNDHPPPIMASFYRSFIGVHEGVFAGLGLRWLYFVAGLFGTATIATGLIFWVQKRRGTQGRMQENVPLNVRLIEKVNIAVVLGLPFAIACYFLGNRLLPVELEGRPQWELHVLFLSWLLMLGHALVRPRIRAWKEQLLLVSLVFLAVPFSNSLFTDRGLIASWAHSDWVYVGFDLTMLGIAAVFFTALRIMRFHSPGQAKAVKIDAVPEAN